jgi:hypothetical protein
MSTRITFDRSVFHGANSARLLQSPLVAYCKSGKYSVYHSTIVIEETLKFLRRPETRADVSDEIRFLIGVGNGRWFRDPWDIWSGELAGQSKDDYLFLSRNEQKNYAEILTSLTDEVIQRSSDEVDRQKTEEKKSNLKRLLVEQRRASNDSFRRELKTKPLSEAVQLYSLQFIDDIGANVIREHVKTEKNVECLIVNWKLNKAKYPYFTLYMKALTYLMYYTELEQNAPIDPNGLMDIYLLGTAKDLDVVVSNDRKFMKSAFDALYGKTKDYMTLDRFLARLS